MIFKTAVIICAFLVSAQAQYPINGTCPEPCRNSKLNMTNEQVFVLSIMKSHSVLRILSCSLSAFGMLRTTFLDSSNRKWNVLSWTFPSWEKIIFNTQRPSFIIREFYLCKRFSIKFHFAIRRTDEPRESFGTIEYSDDGFTSFFHTEHLLPFDYQTVGLTKGKKNCFKFLRFYRFIFRLLGADSLQWMWLLRARRSWKYDLKQFRRINFHPFSLSSLYIHLY